ncbi:MAG: hypothetical protein ABIK20_06460 [Candidatus Omnitrophota bacterium]
METRETLRGLPGPFQAIGIRTVDAKKRIGLGEKLLKFISKTPEAYQVFIDKEGDILLRPVVTIPASEAWIYQNPKVLAQIRQGFAEAKQGKLEKVEDLDVFLKEL